MTDAHIHLSFLNSGNLEKYLQKSDSMSVHRFLMAGYNSADWHAQLKIKNSFPEKLKTCFGIHPWTLRGMNMDQFESEWKILTQLAPTADLIGETGLDGFREKTEFEAGLEETSFQRHLELANNLKKPIVLHLVQEPGRALEILKKTPPQFGGIVHGFSGAPEVAESYIKLGLMISIGPGLTQSKYKKLALTAKKLPLQSLVLETDQPDAPGANADFTLYSAVFSAFCAARKESRSQIVAQLEKNIDSLFSR